MLLDVRRFDPKPSSRMELFVNRMHSAPKKNRRKERRGGGYRRRDEICAIGHIQAKQPMNAAEVLLQGAVQKPKRRQIHRACTMCKRTKAKCSDERPCARCVRTNQAALCVDSDSVQAPQIERPFEFKSGVAVFDPSRLGDQERLDQLLVDCGLQWIAGPLQRCFELGLDVNRVVKIFSTLPECWVALLRDACSAVRVLDAYDKRRLNPCAPVDDAQCVRAIEDAQSGLDRAWDSIKDAGMMRVGFCPEKSRRSSTFVTPYWQVCLLAPLPSSRPHSSPTQPPFPVPSWLARVVLACSDLSLRRAGKGWNQCLPQIEVGGGRTLSLVHHWEW